ncbi:conserved membrane hypothetical protein [Nitrosomonas nitrosa]|uniref:DUF5658 domain-containing protein n=1 Tax=Nitrosomonas nitrosa TaxID=52442 RepID=A0A8H8Z0M2_9PROT|nr:DUF5658 family protein [Nitrosomonas nitrosa]CAE6509123.1 conserved membrane hypothetical protein [Nitrosomonas nitrosa]
MTDTNIRPADQRFRDRRVGTPFFCLYHLGIKQGRRMDNRRSGAGAAYVDCYADHLMLATAAIVFLSAMDAFMTLNILANGGIELNNFMAILMEDSAEKFVYFKLALTAFSAIFLVIHHQVQLTKKIQVKHLIYFILVGYTALICYEIGLLIAIGNIG